MFVPNNSSFGCKINVPALSITIRYPFPINFTSLNLSSIEDKPIFSEITPLLPFWKTIGWEIDIAFLPLLLSIKGSVIFRPFFSLAPINQGLVVGSNPGGNACSVIRVLSS